MFFVSATLSRTIAPAASFFQSYDAFRQRDVRWLGGGAVVIGDARRGLVTPLALPPSTAPPQNTSVAFMLLRRGARHTLSRCPRSRPHDREAGVWGRPRLEPEGRGT